MSRFGSILKSAVISVVALALAPAAMAQATRTWVSGVGDDANPCSRTAPCKTFAGAISKTAANGIINVLDPGGYGTVTITKSITIEGQGSFGGALAAATNGININAAGITVVLRNLSIEGVDTGLTGINYIQGARVTIEKCHIYGFRGGLGMAIRMVPTAGGTLIVKDSTIADSGTGVYIEAGGSPLMATLDNVTIHDTANYAVYTAGAGSVLAVVRRSNIHSNSLYGVYANGPGSVINLVDNSFAFNGGAAVFGAISGSLIRMSGNTIVNNNGALVRVTGAVVESDQTNRVAGTGAMPNATFTNY